MKYVPHNFQTAFIYLSMPSEDIHSFGIFVLIANCEERASSKAYFSIYVHVFPTCCWYNGKIETHEVGKSVNERTVFKCCVCSI